MKSFFSIWILFSDHFQFHGHVTILVFDIFIVIENSALIELLNAQDTPSFIDNEEILDTFMILLSERIVIDVFLELT